METGVIVLVGNGTEYAPSEATRQCTYPGMCNRCLDNGPERFSERQ